MLKILKTNVADAPGKAVLVSWAVFSTVFIITSLILEL